MGTQLAQKLHCAYIQCESKKIPPEDLWQFFSKRLGIFQLNFTCLLRFPIYARLPIFIQLSATLMKLCRVKRDHPVHIMCAKCPLSAETVFYSLPLTVRIMSLAVSVLRFLYRDAWARKAETSRATKTNRCAIATAADATIVSVIISSN